MSALVNVDRISVRFSSQERPALEDVSVSIRTGQLTGVVGPDGAGKTTLLRTMAGLIAPARGRATVDGDDPKRVAARGDTGYMPQRFGLYEDLTVQENLNLYADLRDLPKGARAVTFDRLMEFTDLKRFTGRLAGRLSGGMKQKLGLACALLRRPRLLLLDEPSVGVDPVSRRELWAMVRELVEGESAVVWSTAYLDEAEQCDAVLLLNEGRALFDGRPADLAREAEGRVVSVDPGAEDKRAALSRALDMPAVRDGVIQGRRIRILKTREAVSADAAAMGLERAAEIIPAAPRFEDAFVDRLGGHPGGRSPLSEAFQDKPQNAAPAVRADGLTKRFGDFVAAGDIRFEIPRGEIFGLLGPNGAGKSTTFRMLCGLLKPTAGRGWVAGRDLRRSGSAARARLGYMAQKFSLYGQLSVAQNLDFFASVYGLTGARKRDAVKRMSEIFDLGARRAVAAGDLPLGFKQRLALACAVMHEPDVLFLDEPTSGVDPVTRREFWTHINGLVRKGVAVLVTTHFMDEAENCDRIGLIDRGRMIALDTPDALKRDAVSPDLPDPSLEDAFVAMIARADAKLEARAA